ncbi:MAG: cytochrome-c oxidase, cbb3-type subunit I [Bdellovibrionaceae bacterium]|nr:cytochrome-c oxidase, cbb3-type subunit I [Pseudobdellovibrionaceae bacterium]MBX3034030.1 cytochrome-c oxidase, cbb3-type subunit I [Pseudobdellovibrionaceae bacterium]
MKNTTETIHYDDRIVRYFLMATLLWGGIAFSAGLLVALQLAYWKFNFNLEWLTFGRLRPLHTNAAIFAFAGNAIFAGIYHSTQRLLKTRMASDALSKIHFWGWQLIIIGAAITLPLGYSQSKEYAELEWPLDLAITAIWVVFAVNFFWTIARRRERHLYVALWFYIATIITVAVLHIVNSIEIPVAAFNSYPVWGGIQDALVQWWYGHNAVAFFLTTPFLGLMYYYLPKAANRPIFSYRLSIIHFWALVFIYIWAGPHHLLYTALPDWAQTLGMVFSIMLWAPSWGGMINGLLTLRGAWHLLRTEPVIKFMVAALTFYGMATFEGPLLSIKSVSALGHYTDWIIAHVHGGALGWNGFLTFAMVYYLVPRLWKTPLYSKKLADAHFWVGLLGILLYYTSMVAAGFTQGAMWMAMDKGQLVYPDFVETVVRIVPLYAVRAVGGMLFITGFLIMIYNLYKTIKGAPAPQDEAVVVPARVEQHHAGEGHRRLEGMATVFSILTFLAILVGSAIEIYPTLSIHRYVKPTTKVDPYTPLELAGRDIYIREGCYTCHSQMIRKLDFDVVRYGKPSTAAESMYDRPFQWGSRRIGPDLARVGGKYPDLWHLRHMVDPRSVTPKSIMPTYGWLTQKNTDFLGLRRRVSVLKSLGVPYSDEQVSEADRLAEQQAKTIADGLVTQGAPAGLEKKEMVALIAYLQALGKKGGSDE